MGIFNYCGTYYNSKLHKEFDIETYFRWGNTSSIPYIEDSELDKFVSKESRELKNKDAIKNYEGIEVLVEGYKNE